MRKLVLALFLILLISGCSPKLAQRIVDVNFFDFRPYTENVFFLSPDPFTGKFTPCGELYIRVSPADMVSQGNRQPVKKIEDALYSKRSFPGEIYKEVISADELLKIVVDEAKKVGANGIANLKCTVSSNIYNSTTREYASRTEYYEIRGFAIKISQ